MFSWRGLCLPHSARSDKPSESAARRCAVFERRGNASAPRRDGNHEETGVNECWKKCMRRSVDKVEP